MAQESTTGRGESTPSVSSSIADRMRQAVLLHNTNTSQKNAGSGVIRREDMNLKARVEKVELTTYTAESSRVSSVDTIRKRVTTKELTSDTENDVELQVPHIDEETIKSFLGTLPRADRSQNEFLIEVVGTDGETGIFCVRELPWPISVAIEADSYRLDDEDETYFSEEAERRETLREAIVWIADVSTQTLLHNNDAGFLNRIKDDFLMSLWAIYEQETILCAEDAKILYDAAYSYFSGDSNGMGLHPMIHEVDLLFKVGGLSKCDLRSYTKPEFDRFKIIERARHDAINAPKTAQDALGSLNGVLTPTEGPGGIHAMLGQQNFPPGFFPENMGR